MGLIINAVKNAIEEKVKEVGINAAKVAIDGAQKAVESIEDNVEKLHELAGRALDSSMGDQAERHEKREKRYLLKKKNADCLMIEKVNRKNVLFNISDLSDQASFQVIGDCSSNSKKLNLILVDENKRQIASVKKHVLSLRLPVLHEQRPADYLIETNDGQTVTLKTKLSLNNEDYEIEPYGWTIKGSLLRWDFKVMDGDVEVVHISKRSGYNKPTYILDCQNEEHKILGLMIVLALVCREK